MRQLPVPLCKITSSWRSKQRMVKKYQKGDQEKASEASDELLLEHMARLDLELCCKTQTLDTRYSWTLYCAVNLRQCTHARVLFVQYCLAHACCAASCVIITACCAQSCRHAAIVTGGQKRQTASMLGAPAVQHASILTMSMRPTSSITLSTTSLTCSKLHTSSIRSLQPASVRPSIASSFRAVAITVQPRLAYS